jgi:hypothetical protein
MNGVPLVPPSEIEKLRRELLTRVRGEVPKDCYAVRTSRDGKTVQYLTEQEYKKLMHYD